MVPDQRFQAAVSYSEMSPPRIGRRRILPPTGSGTGTPQSLHPDSAPAKLQHALAASAVAATEEATWAAHRRRDVSASWERPSLITQIQTFAAEHLDLDLSPPSWTP
jgi:hypothetical protein